MKKRKWIRFAIVAAVTVAAAALCLVGVDQFGRRKELVQDGFSALVWFGIAGTLLGGLALYTVADTLSLYRGAMITLLKTVLKLVGAVLMTAANILPFLLGVTEMTETNPWVIGLYGTGYIGAALCALTFYWNERVTRAPKGVSQDVYFRKHASQIRRATVFGSRVYPFVSFASIVIGYLLSTVFAYIGTSVHSFFSVGFGAVLCLLAVIASVIVFRKKFGKKKRSGASSGNGGYTPPDTPKTVDTDHKDGKSRMARVFYSSRLLPYASDVGVIDIDWEKSAYMGNGNFWWNSSKISVCGKIKCVIHKEDAAYASDIRQRILNKTVDIIEGEIEGVLRELRSEYENYGKYEIDCSGISVSSKLGG